MGSGPEQQAERLARLELPADAPDPAEGRELYGRDPAAYEAGRPPYPDAVWQILETRCGLRAGARVLEIGPGTGVVTRRLLKAGASVTAVEPNASMVAHLRQYLSGASLEVVHAPFESADLDPAFDLAVAATSFHWVDRQCGLERLRDLVRRGGWIAIWWMLFENPSDPDDFDRAAESILGRSPAAILEPGRAPFQIDERARHSELNAAGFVDVDSEIIPSTVVMDPDQTRALYATMAIVIRRPADEQVVVLDALETLARRDFGGTVSRQFPTAIYVARNPR